MPHLSFKPGVEVVFTPENCYILDTVSQCYLEAGYDCVVTSGSDGKHSPNSLHYVNRALDFRTRHIPKAERPALFQEIAQSLGQDYDVVPEKSHLHCEHDPVMHE